jgi:hypothetical protein
MTERPSPSVLYAMKRLAEEFALLAEQEADAWRDVPGDVTLRQFALAIRKTNAATFSDG